MHTITPIVKLASLFYGGHSKSWLWVEGLSAALRQREVLRSARQEATKWTAKGRSSVATPHSAHRGFNETHPAFAGRGTGRGAALSWALAGEELAFRCAITYVERAENYLGSERRWFWSWRIAPAPGLPASPLLWLWWTRWQAWCLRGRERKVKMKRSVRRANRF